jgi:hypothetical protein
MGMGAACVLPAAAAANVNPKMSCWYSQALCTELANPGDLWGHWYVGHDEPSLLFYSQTPGSGNNVQYQLQIPSEPAGPFSPSNFYNFELHPTFWFGMALCATQSYPEQLSTCTPDSDSNITNVNKTTKFPGAAYMELQFYSPGSVKQFTGSSCASHKWCVAMNVWSLAEDPINGTKLNPTCAAKILGGIENDNFAYLTTTGKPQGPPNPLNFDFVKSGDPGPTVLYLNPADTVTVSVHDSPAGLVTTVTDITTGQTGSMTASGANGFGQIKFAPNGTQCSLLPYSFHPMYSTSTPQTRVPWAAHSYNVAFSDEIGHFDFCTNVDPLTGNCTGREGAPGDQEPTDGDDVGCFPQSMSLLYPVSGC